MFYEYYNFARLLQVIDKVPKEITICGTAYFLVTDIYKRHTDAKVKIAQAEAKAQIAETELEALKVKRDMQINPSCI